MAKKELKTPATDTIAEAKAEITGTKTATKAATRALASKLTAQSANDPIMDALKSDEQNGSLRIDSTGRGILRIRNRSYEINDPYQTKAEKEQEERAHNGGYTNMEAFKFIVIAVNNIYHPATTPVITGSPQVAAPAGHTVGYTLKSNTGKSYTAIHDETGKVAYYDDGHSCVMPKAVMGSVASFARNDDLIDAGQNFNIFYKFDKDGKVVPKTATESAVALTMTRLENDATKLPYQLDMLERITDQVVRGAAEKATPKTGTFNSSQGSGVDTNVRPSTPFEDAIFSRGAKQPDPSRSIMFQKPQEAKNDRRFELSA